jgi:antitoxin component of RelBE/YafQ-DinJ toxin-antitoxin module
MKNITLAVDENVLADARRYAAARGTTVNALVRSHLEQLARHEQRVKDAIRELREMSENSEGRLGPDYRWNREELYDR